MTGDQDKHSVVNSWLCTVRSKPKYLSRQGAEEVPRYCKYIIVLSFKYVLSTGSCRVTVSTGRNIRYVL